MCDVVGAHAHRPQTFVQRLDPGGLVGRARDIERPRRDGDAGDALGRHGEQGAEGRRQLLRGGNLRLAGQGHAPEVVRCADFGRTDAGAGKLRPIEGRVALDARQSLAHLRPGCLACAMCHFGETQTIVWLPMFGWPVKRRRNGET